MKRLIGYGLLGAALAGGLLLAIGVWGCHGHVIRQPFAPNHPGDFDFSSPPCEPRSRPEAGTDDVLLRYLGTSGLYIEWKGVSILTAPFFSRHGLLRAAWGTVDRDEEAIRRGLEGIPIESVRAVFVGHSHYDHLADLPPILLDLAPRATVYANRSGVNMLSAFPGLEGRLEDLDGYAEDWTPLRDDEGRELPVRFMPLKSGHAGHLRGYHYGRGEVLEPWHDWSGKRLRQMKEGQPYAFLIDLLSEPGGRATFRIHYQDAASSAPEGFPPERVVSERAVDLAVLCIPSYWLASDYPEGLLARTAAGHALLTHYEDFFRSAERPLRFVALLTDRRADRFMARVATEMAGARHRPSGPDPCTCGPCGDAWSMPLPGEWLRFRRPDGTPRSAPPPRARAASRFEE